MNVSDVFQWTHGKSERGTNWSCNAWSHLFQVLCFGGRKAAKDVIRYASIVDRTAKTERQIQQNHTTLGKTSQYLLANCQLRSAKPEIA